MNNMCMEGPGEDALPAPPPASSINDIQTNPILKKKVTELLESGADKKLAEKYDNTKEYLQLLENEINKQVPAQVISNTSMANCKRNNKKIWKQYSQ